MLPPLTACTTRWLQLCCHTIYRESPATDKQWFAMQRHSQLGVALLPKIYHSKNMLYQCVATANFSLTAVQCCRRNWVFMDLYQCSIAAAITSTCASWLWTVMRLQTTSEINITAHCAIHLSNSYVIMYQGYIRANTTSVFYIMFCMYYLLV